MRTKLRSKFALLFLTLGLLLAVPAIALADQIANNVDATVDSTAEIMALQVGSTTGNTTQLSVIPLNGDGKNGCNLTSNSSASFSVNSSDTAVATVSPSTVTFTSCGDVKMLTVTAKAQGTTDISLRQTANNTGATFDLAPATFKVNVTAPPPANTPPQVSVNGVTEGASYEKGSVPAATCQVADTQDGNSSFPATIDNSQLNQYGLGQQTASCSYTDNGNLTASTSKTYRIVDTHAPNIATHADVTAEAANVNGATVTYTNPTATDAADPNPEVSCTPTSGSTFALGDTTVTCTATDATGNTASSTFKVTVADSTGPVLSLPEDKSVEATSAAGAEVDFTASANDAVDGNRAVTCTPESGSTFSLGTTEVTCSASDEAGNTSSAKFNVTVEDTTAPSLNLPDDKTAEATGSNGATVNFTATATDLVDSSVDVSCTPGSGSQFSLGETTVTCTATDNAGNEATSNFKVTVVDTTAPAIAEHDDITGVEATGPGGARVTYNGPTATDLVDTNVNVSCTPASGALFPLGETTVTCTATDNAGNEATSNFKVTVVDTTAPQLNLPENKAVEATGPDGAAVTFARTADDTVDGPVTVNCFVGDTAVDSGDTFALGTTTVDCSATDAAGNTARDSFTVKVVDTTAPTLNLPANITQEATGPNGNVVSFTATANDVVDNNVTVNCTPASGSTFAITTTTVDCSATDAAGNATNGSFTVKVQDTLVPTNIQFGSNINDGDSFYFGNVPASPTCTATDSGSGLQSCVVSVYSTAVGTHTLTATATDKAGNTATRQITYTVKAWTFKGFYQPVDMGGVYNIVKGGSTVPIKFELFKGTTELTDTAYINQPLQATKISCTTGVGTDDIELTATGGTSLRYDTTGGQYIYNWKTPTGANTCYKVTITANDGSSQTAFFKLK